FSGVVVQHDDSSVPVARVADEDFIRLLIESDIGRADKVLSIRMALARAALTNLSDEFAFGGELDDLVHCRSLSPDPHVALPIDAETMLVRRPLALRRLAARSGAAPRADKLAVVAVFDHGRCRAILEIRSDRTKALQDPDVVVGIHGHGRDLPRKPIVGEL